MSWLNKERERELYSESESYVWEIMKTEKEMYASFAVALTVVKLQKYGHSQCMIGVSEDRKGINFVGGKHEQKTYFSWRHHVVRGL